MSDIMTQHGYDQAKSIAAPLKLNNGVTIPCLGFGTWQTPDGDIAKQVVVQALKAGYRHIDTAAIYENEDGVGAGVALGMEQLGLKREEIFVTSKVWNSDRGYDSTLRAFDKTMSKLKLDYLDLYLIHWPANAVQFKDSFNEINSATWKAMCELQQQGRIRAIGISNFLPHHIEPLLESGVVPAVNQIEFHPGHLQSATVDFCRKHGILVEAWAPLGTGRVLGNADLADMAKKYGKSIAQICIRFCLQCGTLPLPKSVNEGRIIENTQVFDFELSAEDIAKIVALGEFGGSGLNPDTVDF